MRRALGWLLAVVLVVGIAGAVVDEVARRAAEQKVAAQVAGRLGGSPQVRAHGWPFLLAVARNRLDGVDANLAAGTMAVDGHQVTVKDLVLHASDISPMSDVHAARAGHLEASARVGYASISRAVGASVSAAGPGRITITKTVDQLGRSTRVSVTGVATVSGDRLVLGEPTATADGVALGGFASSALAELVSEQATLPTKAGVHITGLEPGPDGVVVHVAGDRVDLAALR